jgi:hypothetical protein
VGKIRSVGSLFKELTWKIGLGLACETKPDLIFSGIFRAAPLQTKYFDVTSHKFGFP